MSHKVVNKSSQLQSLLDDSNRLAPFTLALLDDLHSTAHVTTYLRHLIKSYTTVNKNPKHLTVLCLQHLDKEKFAQRNRIIVNSNVTLVNEDDLGGECNLQSEEHLARLCSYTKPNSDNVLLIDSLVPLFMSQADVTVEVATKTTCAWLRRLHDSFSHLVFVLHTDFSADRYFELALSHISTAVIDFRLQSGLSEKQLSCPLVKLTNNSIHVHVVARKKHPRTHLKVARKHEHFEVDEKGDIAKYLSSDELAKVLAASAKAHEVSESQAAQALLESTFNLTLKKDEQEAKDSLVLPYIKKNTDTIQTNAPSLGGQVATNSTVTGSGGQVIYHYDQFDDFDEDDPDDDLDF